MIAPLRTATVTYAGKSFVVRELDFAEKLILGPILTSDPDLALKMHVSFGAVEPKLSVDEVSALPAALAEELLEKVARLTNEAPPRRYRITEIDRGEA